MFLGIDLGTSGVKTVLMDEEGRIVDRETAPLEVSRPRPDWSEQDPEAWWAAADTSVRALSARAPAAAAAVRAIGLSGQMHGATLLDAADRPLRPAILWNDGRSGAACATLEQRVPASRTITGNLAMPGFTAPKLVWVQQHEPDIFAKTARVLLPKDYLRLRMTGKHASDMSDSSGTLWLDVAARCWSEEMLAACGLTVDAMPTLFEGTEQTGRLRPEVADAWGIPRVPVAAGAGDQAAGAIGAGVIRPGDASLALGTSGVYFVSGDRFQPNPDMGVHAFCHALPGTWHQMSVILSAAACVSWVANLTGAASEADLLADVEAADAPATSIIFLPYLSGERTPHNDPAARGVFFGMTHETNRVELARAVLEGVAFALADGQDALLHAGATIGTVSVIGGGARSPLWGRILASVLNRPLTYGAAGDVGPALGAARLARLSVTGEAPQDVCLPPPVEHVIEPDPMLAERYAEHHRLFRRLYRDLRPAFAAERDPTGGTP